VDDFEKQIRTTQRGMKTFLLVRFMNQFTPFYHRVNFNGCNKDHMIEALMRWILNGFEYEILSGKGASTQKQIAERFEKAHTELIAFRKKCEEEDKRWKERVRQWHGQDESS